MSPRTRYFYRVKIWDNFNRESEWSTIQWWETGLLNKDNWVAKWITPNPNFFDPKSKPISMLRTTFQAQREIQSARIYTTAAGVYELYLNGKKVGEDLLAPGWTSYTHRHQYQTYDVTDMISDGKNGIGVMIADGWYKGELTWLSKREIYGSERAFLFQLHIQFTDGSEQVIISDNSWKSSTGPILLSEFYEGEMYDARLEKDHWTTSDFNDSEWIETEEFPLPFDQLVAQENWPTRVTEVLYPKEIIKTPSGETVIDMGQNMVGRVRMKLNLPAGRHIKLYHAEVLDKEGNFYTGNLRKANQRVEYISKGTAEESYAPYFSFQGFRYVKVEGLSEVDEQTLLSSFVGEVMHSDMNVTGEFTSSSELVNKLYKNIVWGQRGNFLDVPTDCPQRDERLGWTGDAQIFIRTAAFNYNVAPFFTKWLHDLKSDQTTNGTVPFVVPNALGDYISSMWGDKNYTSSAWGDAATICPWIIYQCYGDKRLLEEQYPSMKAWVDYIRAQGANEYLWNTGFHFGDWLALDSEENSYFGATPEHLVATAYYAHSTRILRDAARVLDKMDDEHRYNELLTGIINEFRKTFIAKNGRMITQTQTSNILPLIFNLVEGDTQKQIANDLNQLVVKNDFHLNTGFVGTPYLCIALSENGYHKTALRLLLQETYPSWLYSVKKGATTIWEHWDGIKEDGSFWSDDMNSYNHYAYGAIGEWLFRYIAGIDLGKGEIAYKKITIQPRISDYGLNSANASLESPYGNIRSSWQVDQNQVLVEVEIPVNTMADIILPGAQVMYISEGGGELNERPEIRVSSYDSENVTCTVGSGIYTFSYKKTNSLVTN
ncbi:alpha-L-rhamnosidase [Priestia megaterium]|uniref:alpha-L-rhamnosidase n=1 Tax=Priestia megaterium TaxID=1404 RepID=UPI00234EB70C|nr:alpha-L-rhamnosidase [Priestia megaterium]MDC7783185.1 family 78 glycoside hydrolase catalytic domain [Priestia megaterium]